MYVLWKQALESGGGIIKECFFPPSRFLSLFFIGYLSFVLVCFFVCLGFFITTIIFIAVASSYF